MDIYVNPKSGSMRVTGVVNIVDADGNIIETINNPKLCGCGLSETYICDGGHKKKVVDAQRQTKETHPPARFRDISNGE